MVFINQPINTSLLVEITWYLNTNSWFIGTNPWISSFKFLTVWNAILNTKSDKTIQKFPTVEENKEK